MTIIILNTFWPAIEWLEREQSLLYAHKHIQMHAISQHLLCFFFCSSDPSNKVKHIITESEQTKKSYLVNLICAYWNRSGRYDSKWWFSINVNPNEEGKKNATRQTRKSATLFLYSIQLHFIRLNSRGQRMLFRRHNSIDISESFEMDINYKMLIVRWYTFKLCDNFMYNVFNPLNVHCNWINTTFNFKALSGQNLGYQKIHSKLEFVSNWAFNSQIKSLEKSCTQNRFNSLER